MQTLSELYEIHCATPSDINEHLPTLKQYASGCYSVTEFGVRWVCSTYGLMAGIPRKLTSYDVNPVDEKKLAILNNLSVDNNIDFTFVQKNVLTTKIEETDLLFIDTLHSYKQLKLELFLHADKVKSYIILHDTVSFGNRNEGNVDGSVLSGDVKYLYDNLQDKQGLLPALQEFIGISANWVIHEQHTNNNGLTILKRVT